MGKKMRMNKGPLYSFLLYPVAVFVFFIFAATAPAKAAGETGKDGAVAAQTKAADATRAKEGQDDATSEPRIFFESGKSKLNEVLGIDFTMVENGKSRLIVTTEKKATYDLVRKDEKTIVLKINDSTIASPLLMRQIDTTQFNSALEGIKQAYSSKNNVVTLTLSLKEIVTYNVKPSDTGVSIDFGQPSVKAAEKKIVPLDLAETKIASSKAKASEAATSTGSTDAKGTAGKQKGQDLVYLDITNADVTDILKMVSDVSGKNIIWDPAIAGRKVSLVLKYVPWEEALNLILDNNDLGREDRGENIIWIASKEKILQYQNKKKEEAQKKKDEENQEIERQRQLEKDAKENQPIITEYLPIDFVKADDIKKNITVALSKRGNMSVDVGTNTIIISDISSSIEAAKKIIKQFDVPVKQIMIEARIVEASSTFSRELGVKWNSNTSVWTNNEGELSTDSGTQDALNFSTTGEKGMGGSFSTNSPDGWSSNIGLSFATLTSDGLGALTLDASLAIAETDGTAKTLSAPKVIAQQGAEATIGSGETIKIAATENVAAQDWPAKLELKVTPTSISYNGYITLKVSVNDDSRVSDTLIKSKNISTNLMIKSGETIVIGGIIKETEGEDVSGVPVLKDIPGLGWLFKAKSKSTSKTELLIFLTPTVMPSPVKEL